MSIISKSSVKSTFETGDKPTQAEFADFIDTSIRDSMVAIATAAEGGKTGVIEIQGSASVTALPAGATGRLLLETSAASSALAILSAQSDLLGVLTTDGDLLARDAGALVRIAIGTAGTVFGSDGSAASWIDQVSFLTEETTVDVSADDIAFFDDDAAASRKIPVRNFLANGLALDTEQATTSGTSIDFTGIPSTAKRVTIILNGVSTNGTSEPIIRLGDSGGFETTGYAGINANIVGNTATEAAMDTSGINLVRANTAAQTITGHIVFTSLDSTGTIWIATGINHDAGFIEHLSGSKTLSARLTQIRLTTVNGTDAFDAGSINILVE